MKKADKAAKYDPPYYVVNEVDAAFAPQVDLYDLNDEAFDDGRRLSEEFSPSYRYL